MCTTLAKELVDWSIKWAIAAYLVVRSRVPEKGDTDDLQDQCQATQHQE